MTKITLKQLKNDPNITPSDIFPDTEDEKEKKKLARLLMATEPKNYDNVSIEDLPPPDGLSAKQLADVSAPFVDNKLYCYQELLKKLDEQGDKAKIPTFFQPIDDLVDGGFQGGELIIISGITKQGKTSLCQTLSYLQGKNNFPALWFTLEMSWQELIKKFREIDEGEGSKFTTSDLPIFMPIDNSSLSLSWLDSQIKKAQKENHISCIYIDHLHFLLPLKDFNQNVSFLVGGIVRELKKIAVKRNIPIFLVAHTKKMDTQDEPDLNSVRDSSFITQESDFTFLIWRQRAKKETSRGGKKDLSIPKDDRSIVYHDYSWLSLEANRRNGLTRRMPLGFWKNRFYPYEEYEQLLYLTDAKDKINEVREKKDEEKDR